MKRNIVTLSFFLTFGLIYGQSGTDFRELHQTDWQSRTISEGITLKSAATNLFNSAQAIYVVEIDTAEGAFEFGVAVAGPPLVASAFALQEKAMVAVNATFFNMKEGYNVHYVKVNDSTVAVTDEKEFGIFELRVLAHSLGCTDALNLDGGGSTTMVVAGEGSNGVVNKPSGKVERPVPSILFVRNNN